MGHVTSSTSQNGAALLFAEDFPQAKLRCTKDLSALEVDPFFFFLHNWVIFGVHFNVNVGKYTMDSLACLTCCFFS